MGGVIHPLAEALADGVFIALPAEPAPPKWLQPVSTLLASGEEAQVEGQSPGGLLVAPRGSKTFVMTFGYGHTKVKDEWVEPEFGKSVALSMVPQGQVREVRAEQVFAKRHISSERAPRASAVREFGYEPDRDLVSAVEGMPESTYWPLIGTRVRGGVALKFDLDFARLPETLDRIAERFDSNDHKQRWPQASNFVPIRALDRIAELDALVDLIFAGPQVAQHISLAAPNELSGDKPYPQHFVIGRMSVNVATTPYLTLASWGAFLTGKGSTPSTQQAQSTTVHLLDENKEEISSCSFYQCIGVEVTLDGLAYVLSSGIWYVADQQFIANTNAVLATLVSPSHMLSAWNQIDHEDVYNSDACTTDAELWLFDRQLVNFGGGASRFEFCDLMHFPSKTLYFVKHPTGSAGVSHLCEQVRRTAENFFSPDQSYRNQLTQRINQIGNGWDVSWLASRPKRHEWNLCLVLMGKPAASLAFFAKCGIARLLRELQREGYTVSFQSV
jgi:uncharacterized protein (TIGR04141 family)